MENENIQDAAGSAGSPGAEGGASAGSPGGSEGAGAQDPWGSFKFDPGTIGVKDPTELETLLKEGRNAGRLRAIFSQKGERRNREFVDREAKLRAREEAIAAREAAPVSGRAKIDSPYHQSIAERYARFGMKLPPPDELGDDTRVLFDVVAELADKVGGIDKLSQVVEKLSKGFSQVSTVGSVREEEAKVNAWEKDFYTSHAELAKYVKDPKVAMRIRRAVLLEVGERPDFEEMADEEYREALHNGLLEHFAGLGIKPTAPIHIGGGAGSGGRGKSEKELDWSNPEDQEAILAAAQRDTKSGGP